MVSFRLFVALAALSLSVIGSAQVLPREVRQRILQAVVEIRPYDDAQGALAGWSGSGTIISPDGYVLTNYHVVGDLERRTAFEWHAVLTTDPSAPDQPPRHTYWARFVAGDPTHDLAIVRIEQLADESPVPAGTRFTAMPVGDSNALIPGDPLTVVGYPGISGATVTFTTGIVSGWLGEDLAAGGKQWIKTDAKIARGNSGGAAFDENGWLVGIPTLLQQSNDGGVFEEQFYLRPVAIAWALLGPNVANVERAAGVTSEAIASRPAAPAPAPGPAEPGAAFASLRERGELRTGDETLDNGTLFDVYDVAFTAGAPVRVDLSSSQFDPYLVIFDPAGEIAFEKDDSAGAGLNVLETFTPAASGPHQVVVLSVYPDGSGGYDLSVADAALAQAPAPTPAPTPADPLPSSPAAAIDVRELGVLDRSDTPLEGDLYVETFEIGLTAGSPVTISLSSTEFDPLLVILDPAGEIAFDMDDSAGQGLNVLETWVPAVSGPHLVGVMGAYAGQMGAFDLQVRSASSAAPPAPANPPSPAPANPLSPAPANPLSPAPANPLSPAPANPLSPAPTDPSAPQSVAPPAQGTGSGFVGEIALGTSRTHRLTASGGPAYHTYVVDVPPGTRQLTVTLQADADLDLFLKHGSEILDWGDDGDWDERDLSTASHAQFVVPNPNPGLWYLDVTLLADEGSSAYTIDAR